MSSYKGSFKGPCKGIYRDSITGIWVVISGLIRKVNIVITHIRGLIIVSPFPMKPNQTLQNTMEPLKEPT